VTLKVHRAVRADQLVTQLAELLSQPLPDPFAGELVITPAKGTERWLSQHISHRLGTSPGAGDGVCAGVEFATPTSLANRVVGQLDDDPWEPAALVWPLLSLIDEHFTAAWCAPLAQHLGYVSDPDDLRKGRRYAVARRIAGLFTSYAAQRPALLTDWEAGLDSDGNGGALPEDLAWQAQLWRLLRSRIQAPTPIERHRAALQRLGAAPSALDLPPRISLFGHTRIPAGELELIRALGEHRDVHLWLPHPSPTLWEALTDRPVATSREGDDSHAVVVQPVLRSLGRNLRELQATLGDVDTDVAPLPDFADGLLGRLQRDIADNRVGDPQPLEPGDNSISVHACHGTARQVEVLREVILGLLADDPTLEPRDILVMCPDIETYVPLLTAAFGMGAIGSEESPSMQVHPGHQLRVLLADRAPAQTNELLGVLSRVLAIAGGRAEASQVLDLMAVPAVRRRFGFSDDDLERITEWVSESGVRWAFDAPHRESYGLGKVVHDTWCFGIDRILAGVAVSDDANTWFGTTLPLDDVSSSSIDLAGRLAEFIDRLAKVTDDLTGDHPVSHWLATLVTAAESLSQVERGEEWQLGQLHRELANLGADSEHAEDVSLRLSDIRALMAERLAGRPSRANFRSGTLTVCTMTPMRSVPHRVVCLLGLDDGRFPRAGSSDGDDVLLRGPLLGERDPRNEDRQLLLDAIMSATDHLVITYTGANETTNQPKPPSVPLQELLDCLSRLTDSGQITIRHPLQPFAAANFTPALTGGKDNAFSFDQRAHAAALAAIGKRRPPASLAEVVIPASAAGEISLEELTSFLKSPAKAFLRSSLEIGLPEKYDAVGDAIPIDLDALEEWKIGDQILAELLSGRSPDEARDRIWRTGALPPGKLGWAKVTSITRNADQIAGQVLSARDGAPAESIDVRIDLGNGIDLTGTVSNLYGHKVVQATYSKTGQKQWLDLWVHHLALALAKPDLEATSVVHGRGWRDKTPVARATLRPITDLGHARTQLRRLVDLHQAGLTKPLLLPLKTAEAWVRHAGTKSQHFRAAQAWQGSRFPGESADPEQVLLWGAGLSLNDLLDLNPDFDRLARIIWEPLLAALEVAD